MITTMEWKPGSKVLTWVSDGRTILKTYEQMILAVTPLRENSGVAIVLEPKSERERDAAIVFSPDGSERFHVKFPLTWNYAGQFIQFYYESEKDKQRGLIGLHADLHGSDWMLVIDERTGQIIRQHETR